MTNPVQKRPDLTSIKPYIPEPKTAIAGTGGFVLGSLSARILTNLARQRSKELQAQHIKKTDDAQARQTVVSSWRLAKDPRITSTAPIQVQVTPSLTFGPKARPAVPASREGGPARQPHEGGFMVCGNIGGRHSSLGGTVRVETDVLVVNVAPFSLTKNVDTNLLVTQKDLWAIFDGADRPVGATLIRKFDDATGGSRWAVVGQDGVEIPEIEITERDALNRVFSFRSTKEVGSLPPSKYHTIANNAKAIQLAAAGIGGIAGFLFSQKK